MALIEMLTPEVLTAVGVSFGAVFGGVAALIGELRKPGRSHVDHEQAEREASEASAALLEEEVEHLTRTMWIIERRLSDHLVRIEGRLSLTVEDEKPPPRAARRKPAAPAIEPARTTQQDLARDE